MSDKLSRPCFVNSAGIAFVYVGKGSFFMGSPETEPARRKNEGHRHVEHVESFYLSATPVTQEQYVKIIHFNPSYFSLSGGGKTLIQGMETSRFPVESVSWEEANSFCAQLSNSSEERKNGRTYRLPRETEWEYACRGGTDTPFHTGRAFTSYDGNIAGLYPYGCQTVGETLNRPAAAGSYPSNAFGLYDMHGNVWEWCLEPYYEYDSGRQFHRAKVLRGGSWNCYSRFCRSAYRCICENHVRYYDCGFRVICEMG